MDTQSTKQNGCCVCILKHTCCDYSQTTLNTSKENISAANELTRGVNLSLTMSCHGDYCIPQHDQNSISRNTKTHKKCRRNLLPLFQFRNTKPRTLQGSSFQTTKPTLVLDQTPISCSPKLHKKLESSSYCLFHCLTSS